MIPAIARWSSTDPLGETTPNWTPYRFSFNNPISVIDPHGLTEEYYNDGYGVTKGGSASVDGGITILENGNAPDDHIKVNSSGVVTEVVEMEGSNRFFDEETGNELLFNDLKYNPHDQSRCVKFVDSRLLFISKRLFFLHDIQKKHDADILSLQLNINICHVFDMNYLL